MKQQDPPVALVLLAAFGSLIIFGSLAIMCWAVWKVLS